jgi:hypothetical protein
MWFATLALAVQPALAFLGAVDVASLEQCYMLQSVNSTAMRTTRVLLMEAPTIKVDPLAVRIRRGSRVLKQACFLLLGG